MKRIGISIILFIIRFIYFIFRPLKIKNKVCMLSRQSNDLSADFDIIKSWIDGMDEVSCVVLTKMIEGHKLSYPFHMIRQIYHIAGSRLVIIDGYCIAVSCLDLKKGTKVIQLWHAGAAVKKFGWQTVGKPSGHSLAVAEMMNMHKNYDHVFVPSRYTADIFSRAMKTDISKFEYSYQPHVYELIRNEAVLRRKITEKYNLGNGKKTILYAPTFRRGKQVRMKELADAVDFEKYNFIFRPHPLESDHELADGRIIIACEDQITDLIAAADIVITDYSSLIVETLVLDKELYIYDYDIDEYSDDPGLNIDFRDGIIGEYAFSEPEMLTRLLCRQYDKSKISQLKKMLLMSSDTGNEIIHRMILDILGSK